MHGVFLQGSQQSEMILSASGSSFPHLCHVLQPPAQRDEHKQHRGGVEEGDRVHLGSLSHCHQEDDEGVEEGDGCCQHHEHVHVGSLVPQCSGGLDVEVPPSEHLQWHFKHL